MIPVLLISFVSSSNTSIVLNHQVANQLLSLALTKEAQVKTFVESQVDVFKAFSSRTKLRNTLSDHYVEPNAEQLTTIKKILTDAKGPFDHVKWISVFSRDGTLLAGTDTLNAMEHKGITDHLDSAKVVPEIFVLNDNENIIVIGPMLRDDEFLGYMVFESTMAPLEAMVSDYRGLGDTGEVVIAMRDQNGDARFLHKRRFEGSVNMNTVQKTATDVPITQALLKNRGFFFDAVDYRGQDVVAATGYAEAADWGIVVKIDKQELFTHVRAFRSTITLFIVITTLVILIISFAVAKALLRPIEFLTRSAEHVSKGEFGVQVPSDVTSEENEIGLLARTFQSMAKNLASLYVDLERKVQDRTKKLDAKIGELEELTDVMLGREEKMIELKKQLKKCKKDHQ